MKSGAENSLPAFKTFLDNFRYRNSHRDIRQRGTWEHKHPLECQSVHSRVLKMLFHAKLSHTNIGNMTFFEGKEQGRGWKRLVTYNWAFLPKCDAFDF